MTIKTLVRLMPNNRENAERGRKNAIAFAKQDKKQGVNRRKGNAN